MESKKNEILSTIKGMMQLMSFEEMETDSIDFPISFVQKGPGGSNRVFLVVDFKDQDVQNLKGLKTNARAWCVQHFDANIKKNCGLNIILLHKKEITEDSMKILIDRSSLNVPILQSITAINIGNLSVSQSRTWIVEGIVKKILKELKNISVS